MRGPKHCVPVTATHCQVRVLCASQRRLLCRVYDGTLRMGILPVALFAGGHTFFAQRMAQRMGLAPYAVHATFQFSGTPGKRHRLRERMVRPPLLLSEHGAPGPYAGLNACIALAAAHVSTPDFRCLPGAPMGSA